MPTNTGRDVLSLLRQFALREGETLTDGGLLAAFVQRRDEAALTALVHRHSGLVWGVCRRLLGDGQDSEDAFQATFLVLVRKAAGLRDPEKVANWLCGVARQTAVRLRTLRARQGNREKQVAIMPEAASPDPELWNDLAAVLDEELSRLPERYRAVLILCDLEERPRSEVARQLGCPEGTVAGRLARARALLAGRLTRRGVTPASSLAAALAAQSEALPPTLIPATVQAALTGTSSTTVALLISGALNAMFLSRLKLSLALVFSLVLAIGGGLLARPAARPEAQAEKRQLAVRAPGAVAVAARKVPREPLPPARLTWVRTFANGWMLLDEQGKLKMDWADLERPPPGAVPAFQLAWRKGDLPKMPAPGAPFGLELRVVTDEGLKEVSKFKDLHALNVSGTLVTFFGLRELVRLKNLRWLDLSGTLGREMDMKEVGKLKTLHALNLTRAGALDASGVGLTDAGLKEFAGLKELRSLQLADVVGKVTDRGVKGLTVFTELRVLDLGGTQTGDTGLKALAGLKHMQVLSLRGTGVTDAGLKALTRMPDLRALDLTSTRVTDRGLKALAELKRLQKLDLGNTPVTDAGLKELAGLKGLESLELWATRVSDAGMREVAGLKGLRKLSLRGTGISDAGLRELAGLKNLRVLDLGGRTRVTLVGAAALKKALPGCEIVGFKEE